MLPLSVSKALVHLVVLCVSGDGQRAVKQAREKMAEKLGASAQTAKVRHTKKHDRSSCLRKQNGSSVWLCPSVDRSWWCAKLSVNKQGARCVEAE